MDTAKKLQSPLFFASDKRLYVAITVDILFVGDKISYQPRMVESKKVSATASKKAVALTRLEDVIHWLEIWVKTQEAKSGVKFESIKTVAI